MRFALVLIVVCLSLSIGLSSSAKANKNLELNDLQNQVRQLHRELAELKAIINKSVDGAVVLSVAKDKREHSEVGIQTSSAGDVKLDVKGDSVSVISGSPSSQVDKNQIVSARQNASQQVMGDSSHFAGQYRLFESGKKTLIAAADELSLKAGKASIVLTKNGDIMINGRVIDIKATNDVVIKGSKVNNN